MNDWTKTVVNFRVDETESGYELNDADLDHVVGGSQRNVRGEIRAALQSSRAYPARQKSRAPDCIRFDDITERTPRERSRFN